MNRLICLSWYFPPACSATRQRPVKLLKYLREAGWEPVVLSVREAAVGERDESLGKDVPPRLRVERTGFVPIDFWKPFFKLALPPRSQDRSLAGWVPFAVFRGLRVIREEHCRAIVAFSAPNTALIAGWLVSLLSGLPLLVNLGDPWTLHVFARSRKGFRFQVSRWIERRIFKHAVRVIFTAQETVDDYQRLYPEFPPEKWVLLPNGYDPEDLEGLGSPLPGPPIRIAYTGSLFPERALSGLFESLRNAAVREPLVQERLRFAVAGYGTEGFLEAAAAAGLTGMVEGRGVLSHREALALVAESHLAFAVTYGGRRLNNIPLKVYEYLALGKSVLALTPAEGPLARFLKEANGGMCFPPTGGKDLEDFWIALARLELTLKFVPSPDFSETFSRPNQARQLAGILDETLHSPGFKSVKSV